MLHAFVHTVGARHTLNALQGLKVLWSWQFRALDALHTLGLLHPRGSVITCPDTECRAHADAVSQALRIETVWRKSWKWNVAESLLNVVFT